LGNPGHTFDNPYDNPLSASTRFAVEIIAWVAASISLWLVIPAIAILIGLPEIFSTVGDNRKIVVATPGPVRVAIELLLYVVAIAAPWTVWPLWLAVLTTAIVLIAIASGLRRTRWLLKGAPTVTG
jgi:hypothetical protein